MARTWMLGLVAGIAAGLAAGNLLDWLPEPLNLIGETLLSLVCLVFIVTLWLLDRRTVKR